MKNRFIVVALALVTTQSALAALPQASSDRELVYLLSKPYELRVKELKKFSSNAYKRFAQIAASSEHTMSVRWNAVMAMATVGREQVIPDLMKMAKDETWYMRNAALVGLRQLDQNLAMQVAREHLRDKALLVRTAAVETIEKLNNQSLNPDLWQALSETRNYIKGRSLFIRAQIAKLLSEQSAPGNEKQFVDLLKDTDPKVQESAVQALEKITGQILGEAEASIENKKKLWQAWWQEHQKL